MTIDAPIAPFYLVQTFATTGAELFEEQHLNSFDEAVKLIEEIDSLKGVRVFHVDIAQHYSGDVTEEIAQRIADKSFDEWERPHYAICEWLDHLDIEYCNAAPCPSYVDLMMAEHGVLNRRQQL